MTLEEFNEKNYDKHETKEREELEAGYKSLKNAIETGLEDIKRGR